MPDSLEDSLELWRSQVPWVSDSNNRAELILCCQRAVCALWHGIVTTDINSAAVIAVGIRTPS